MSSSSEFVDDYVRQRKKIEYSVPELFDDPRALNSSVRFWVRLQSKKQNAVFGDPDLGIPTGRIIEIIGGESHGKSALLYHLLAAVQKKGGLAVLADPEGGFREEWAKRIGVDLSRLLHLGTDPNGEEEGLEALFGSFQTVISVGRE